MVMEFVDVFLVCVLNVTQAYREQEQGQPMVKSEMRQSRSNTKKVVHEAILRLGHSVSHLFLVPSLMGVDVAVACGFV